MVQPITLTLTRGVARGAAGGASAPPQPQRGQIFFKRPIKTPENGLHNFGACWVRLRLTWYRLPPKPKILATPLLTVYYSSKIQIGFTFLVPAHPDSPRQRAIKQVWLRMVANILHLLDAREGSINFQLQQCLNFSQEPYICNQCE